jgi:glutathione S-transferase
MSQFTLIMGNKNYSSWSLRAWLVLKHLAIPFEEVVIPLYREESRNTLLHYSPSGKVPVLKHGEYTIWDSLAICEYLSEIFPDRRLWPADLHARAYARSISAEMHSEFQNLRQNMPMNCRLSRPGYGGIPDVDRDIERIVAIWTECRRRFGSKGDFLFGTFGIADAMYAPVASRFKTYGVTFNGVVQGYVNTIMDLPSMKEWYDSARKEPYSISMFD